MDGFLPMPMSDRVAHFPSVLILGGTAEASALAEALTARYPALRVVTSLAGRTEAPVELPGEVRVGGFGGVAALADYLCAECFDALIDATHPFAAQISANACQAAEQAGVPRLRVDRPPWETVVGDDWHMVANLGEAASVLPRFGRRAFLTVGRRDLDAFAACADMWFLVRLVDMPDEPLPLPDCRVVAARGPFTEAEEAELLARHEIDVVVCKASGGAMTYAKLEAARARCIPVVMVSRPADLPGERVENVDLAVKWLLDLFQDQASNDAPERRMR